MKNYAVHIFTRDLRVQGNLGLRRLIKDFGRSVLAIAIVDQKLRSPSQYSFYLETLKELQLELEKIGSELLVIESKNISTGLSEVLEKLRLKPSKITLARDYDKASLKEIKNIEKICHKEGIGFESFRNHLLIEPSELSKEDGSFYKVYTPFSRKWMKLLEDDNISLRIKAEQGSLKYLSEKTYQKIFDANFSDLLKGKNLDRLEDLLKKSRKNIDINIPKAGAKEAFKKLKEFKKRIDDYSLKRDNPSDEITSGLSIYLRFGSITISQIIYFLDLKPYIKKNTGKEVFLSELIWREFYYHILYHFPFVEKEEFVAKYRGIAWENDKSLYSAWKEGRTGFPIVDAGMRELNQTGRMHNRVRMIVASFLIKDLLIDWRWGEKYFMQKLLDGDCALNNGGWQWAASTGCDAQPYFRIFNPWLQSKKFDPEGRYIKKFVPELSEVDPKKLHHPFKIEEEYIEQVVDHSVQRLRALALFKEIE